MTGWLRNGRMIFIAACLLGAGLLAASAMLGDSSQAQEKWTPMNDMLAEALTDPATGNESESAVEVENGNGATGHHDRAGDDVKGGEVSGGEAIATQDVLKETELQVKPGNVAAEATGNKGGSEVSSGDSKSGGSDVKEVRQSAYASDGRLDINRADAGQLDGLKGIGPSKAQAIVDDREENGYFRGAEDLLRVKGIGEKLLASIKESVVALP